MKLYIIQLQRTLEIDKVSVCHTSKMLHPAKHLLDICLLHAYYGTLKKMEHLYCSYKDLYRFFSMIKQIFSLTFVFM